MESHHPPTQDSYATTRLVQQLPQMNDEQLKREYLNYLKWTQPIAQILAQVEDEAQASRVVLLALEVDLRLGAKLAGAVKHELEPQTVRLIEELEIPQLLKIQLLGETGSEKAIPALEQALQDEDSGIRETAADALRDIGTDTAVSVLLQALNENEDDYSIQESATYALEDIGTEAAVLALLQRLNNKNPHVRERAIIALGNIGTETVVPALVEALKDGRSHNGETAAEALSTINSEAVVSALLQTLKGENSYARSNAASALGEIGTEAAVPALIKALNDEVDYVRASAAEALGKIGASAAVPGLILVLNDEVDYVRSAAAEALGKIGSQEAELGLLKALNDASSPSSRSTAVAYSATEALSNIAPPELMLNL
ncbi:MAG TPA: HEAT repeat domain-containing protein, partial [Coleofasciculaceae cyanobacterium]